jgi:hypothetical protein
MKDSLYDKTNTRKTRLKNTGFNYRGQILRRSLSPYLYREETRASILEEIDRIITFWVDNVKTIKTFYNYTVPKDYTDIN